ncbi:alpha-2,8-sialyltransferase 8F isoform X2 [Protopterus annectens]|uniref:alpha-2,8-sialyltransferase 8F isoform X2 n=1 Tax=Protopterus annectens TaxID=7888 RepID=UPI001CFBC3D5|nr:alpha-2,8-sialyltransferase 8F isoform X2 [Protopterus annectens]
MKLINVSGFTFLRFSLSILAGTCLVFIVTFWMKLEEPRHYRVGIHPNGKNITSVNMYVPLHKDVRKKTRSEQRQRFSDDYYLERVKQLEKLSWEKQPNELQALRLQLSICCNATNNFIVSRNNTPLGTNISYEVDRRRTIAVTWNIFRMLPESQALMGYPYKTCAVVGNSGILRNSSCREEIDHADFVFRYDKLTEKIEPFLNRVSSYGKAFLLLPAFSYRSNTAVSFKVYHIMEHVQADQKPIFFHPNYLRNLAKFWRSQGIKAYRLSSGFMLVSVALELCEDIRLYGFWPFSRTTEGKKINHHYYDDQSPKPGFHAMPTEFYQYLKLHSKGIVKVQLGKCTAG